MPPIPSLTALGRQSVVLCAFFLLSSLTIDDSHFVVSGLSFANASRAKETTGQAKATTSATPAAEASADGDAAAFASAAAPNPLDAIAHVVHGTSTSNLADILSLFALKAQKGNPPLPKGLLAGQRLNKGVFTSLLFTCNNGKQIPKQFCAKDIFLVFDKRVLLDLDFHSSNTWCGGGLFAPANDLVHPTTRSYRKEQFPQFIQTESARYCSSVTEPNETVFTTNIDLRYLREIWVCNYPTLKKMISTPRPDGTYKRTFPVQPHDAAGIAARVRELMSAAPRLRDVPVRIVDTF